MAMYLRNNEQRDPSEIRHFLCYICGDMFRVRFEYQMHLMQHQVFQLIYQIYDDDKTQSEQKAKEEARKDPDQPGPSRQRSEENKKAGRKHAVVRRRKLEELEQAIREERAQYLREKQHLEEVKAQEERQRRIEAARERREIRKRKLAEVIAMNKMKEHAFPIEKKKPPTGAKVADLVAPKAPTGPKQPSSSLKSRRTPAAAQPLLPRITSTGFDIGALRKEKCPYCGSEEMFDEPVEAIQHIVGHGASIADLKFVFFEDDKFVASEAQISGDNCNMCDVNFDFATQYYMHLLTKHRSCVALFYQPFHPNANNVEIVVELVYRTLPEHTIRFREIIPKLAMNV